MDLTKHTLNGAQVLVVVAVVMCFVIILNVVNTQMQSSNLIDQDAKDLVSDMSLKGVGTLDIITMMGYFTLTLLILVASYLTDSNVKLASFGLVYILLTTWVFPFLTDTGLAMLTANSYTVAAADLLPGSTWIITNLTLLQTITGFLILLVRYGKSKLVVVGGSEV